MDSYNVSLRRLSLGSPATRKKNRASYGYKPDRRRVSLATMENVNEESSCNAEVGNASGRRSSLTGESTDMDFLAELKAEALSTVKEDLCDWLTKTLGIEISAQTFIDVLDNGVYVCKLAQLIQDKAQTAYNNGLCQKPPAQVKISYRANARTGTWFARDNTANFIHWCKEYGVKAECLFETEGLVLHKDERTVVLCLLELARLGVQYGMEPPSLVAMEREIDDDEVFETSSVASSDAPSEASTCSVSSSQEGAPVRRRKNLGHVDDIDQEVKRISGTWQCDVKKIKKGKYNIAGKQMFVRLLKGSKAMVRVGGGWDTLEHYLATHNPQKVMEFKRDPKKGDKFLYIKGQYKSS